MNFFKPFMNPEHHRPNDPCDPCHPAPKPCCGPEFTPVPPPIQPVMPVPGSNVQAQMMQLCGKVNECIDRWNYISQDCYAALNRVVGAAVCNDVYYDYDEVKLENGYDTNDECAYHVVNVKCVDKADRPIRVKLGLAYDNTTNSDLKQSIQDVSFIKNANVIITAVSPDKTGWQGQTMYVGAPINSTADAGVYIAGFNDHGALKVFPGDTDAVTLKQNCIVDAIGAVSYIIRDGEITEDAKKLTTKAAISAIGYKSGNGDKVFFQCSNEDAKGMQGITVANLLKDMGCTTAVITAAMVNSELPESSNGMMYLGSLTDTPNGGVIPSCTAYWYISKRPFEGWPNKFTSEIADLVQRVGFCFNLTEANRHRLDHVVERVKDNTSRIENLEDEVADINAELVRINSELDRIEDKLDQEVKDRIAGDEALDAAIKQETQERKDADQVLTDNLNKEIQDRKDADTELNNTILEKEKESIARDDALGKRIDKEITDRTDADTAINNRIDQEITDRKHADSALEDEIHQEVTNRSNADAKEAADRAAADKVLQDNIDAEAGTRSSEDTKLRNQIDAEEATRSDEDTKLRNMINQEANDRSAQDTIINTRIDNIVNGTTELGYVKKTGDTMSGNLNMDGNEIQGVTGIGFAEGSHFDEADGKLQALKDNENVRVSGADAVDEQDFVTKKQLDENVPDLSMYVKRDGSTPMTANVKTAPCNANALLPFDKTKKTPYTETNCVLCLYDETSGPSTSSNQSVTMRRVESVLGLAFYRDFENVTLIEELKNKKLALLIPESAYIGTTFSPLIAIAGGSAGDSVLPTGVRRDQINLYGNQYQYVVIDATNMQFESLTRIYVYFM